MPSNASDFVGREQELATLCAGLDGALARRGQLHLLTGEAGIGKTRLAEEFCKIAAGQGMHALWGRAWESGGPPPFWPWVQIVRGALRDPELAAAVDATTPGGARILGLLPEHRGEVAASPAVDSERQRFELFDAVTEFLRSAADARGLTLVFDDLHAMDAPSLLLLGFSVRHLRDARIVFVATLRTSDARSESAAEQLHPVAREAKSLPLTGLAPQEIAGFVQRRCGVEPRPEVVAAIQAITAGNPYFLEEVLPVLLVEGRLDHRRAATFAGADIPENVRAAIRQRLRSLTPGTRALLATASVVGGDFDVALLDLCGDGGSASDAVREAAAARLIHAVPGRRDRYSFVHVLVREVLREELPAESRRRLHGRVAAAFERLHAADLEAHVAELAHHYSEAGEPEARDKAVDYRLRAAEKAMKAVAYEEAVAHYERLLGLVSGPGSPPRSEVLLGLGSALWKAGDVARAKETFLEAADRARAADDPGRFARAALGYGAGGGGLSYSMAADPELVDLLEEALHRLPEDDRALRSRCMARLASELYFTPLADRRRALAREALAIADALGDDGARLGALFAAHQAHLGPDGLDARIEATTEIVELAERLGDRELAFRGRHFRFHALYESGDAAGAHADLAICLRLAESLRQPFYRWRGLAFSAAKALVEGRFHDAEELADRALAVGRDCEPARASEDHANLLFTLRWATGRLSEIEPMVSDLAREHPAIPTWRVALAYARSELGRDEEARADFEMLATNRFADLPRDGSWLVAIGLSAYTCASLGDEKRAEILYDLLEPYDGRIAMAPGCDAPVGSVATALGTLAATMRRWDVAVAHFERGLAQERKFGNRPFLALTMYEYAAMLVSRDRAEERAGALALLGEATALAEAIGMSRVSDRAHGLRSRLRATPASPPPSASAAAAFYRCGDIWTISFEGRTLQVRDTKGLRYIAELIRHVGSDVHVFDLLSTGGEGRPGDAASPETGTAIFGHAGALVDERAKGEYRRRLVELDAELEEATRWADTGRQQKIEQEIAFLNATIVSAFGLGNRSRKGADVGERARKAVTNRIHDSIGRLQRMHPALGQHLHRSIRTGAFCCYASTDSTAWTLDSPP